VEAGAVTRPETLLACGQMSCTGLVGQLMEPEVGQFAAREVEFAGDDGTTLAGTLTLPSAGARCPVVVAVHAAQAGGRGGRLGSEPA
jgi:hypothetical protein